MFLVLAPEGTCTCAEGLPRGEYKNADTANAAIMDWLSSIPSMYRAVHYRGRHVLNAVFGPRTHRFVKGVGGPDLRADLNHHSQHRLTFVDVRNGQEYDWRSWRALAKGA